MRLTKTLVLLGVDSKRKFPARQGKSPQGETVAVRSGDRKRLDGSELDGSEHFEKNCQNVPGAAGAAVGAAAGAAAASAVCILSCTYTGARSAPPVIT